jgi:hypothetical protein
MWFLKKNLKDKKDRAQLKFYIHNFTILKWILKKMKQDLNVQSAEVRCFR